MVDDALAIVRYLDDDFDATSPTTSGGDDNTGYGPKFSSAWGEYFEVLPDTDQAVDVLVELADGRPVLEFGIGMGRLDHLSLGKP